MSKRAARAAADQSNSDRTQRRTRAPAHKEARRSVPTRRPILVVGQAHPECAGLCFQDAPTVGLASGFACWRRPGSAGSQVCARVCAIRLGEDDAFLVVSR